MEEEGVVGAAGKAVTDTANALKLGDPIARMTAQLNELWIGFVEAVPQIVVGIVIVILTLLIARAVKALAERLARKAHLRPSLVNFVRMLSGLAAWVFGLLIAAVVVFPSLTPASIVAGLGLGTVAVGFAFKDIFENFFAGVFILLRKDMRIGDFIECEGIDGQVANIFVRETHIRETDGELVIVPNSLLFKSPLTIRTDRDVRRTTIICGVSYDTDVDAARDVIRDAVATCDSVIQDGKPIQIFAQEFASSSINFEVTWWTGSKPVDIRRSRDQVVSAVKRALDDAGIEIPFPYRTLTFKQPLSLAPQQPDEDGEGRGDGEA